MKARKHPEAAVDMTPMLDIVFIMLIFFIVTATFVKETGVTINKPEGVTRPPIDDLKNLVFQVEANNKLSMNGRDIDIWSAEALAKEAITVDPDTSVAITIKKGANMQTFIRIYDGLRNVGVPKHQLPVFTRS